MKVTLEVPRAIVLGERPRALVRAMTMTMAMTMVITACASASDHAPRRNRMEAAPLFPVAPDFRVPDATGAAQTLGSLMGPRGLVLVLYRGHW